MKMQVLTVIDWLHVIPMRILTGVELNKKQKRGFCFFVISSQRHNRNTRRRLPLPHRAAVGCSPLHP